MSRFVSVLMPVLNEEGTLRDAVASVLDQEGCDVEVLVIDGCSADRTAAIATDLAHKDSRVRVLSNPAVTIPAGLNVGLRAARGVHVARIDGHAQVSTGYLKAALDWLEADPRLAAVGGRRIGVARTRVGRSIGLALSSPYGVGNSINHYSPHRQLTDHATFGVYRAEIARAVGGWDEALPVNEDVDFDHRIIAAGHTIGYEPTMVIDWHVREKLGGLFRQYRRYGRGKAAMIRKNGTAAVRPRHLAPPVAVVGSVLLVIGAAVQPWLLLGLLPYASLIGFATAVTWRGRDRAADASLPAVPAALMTTHAAWGLGLLEGLLLRLGPALASGSAKTVQPVEAVEVAR